jgi:integrase
MEEKTLLIECSASAKGVVGPPKSSAGYREIPLSDTLIERIGAFRATASAAEDDFIMPNAKGGICHSGWLLKQVYLAFNAFDWPKDKRTQTDQRRFNIHELRHYAISSWIAADLGVKAVQTYAGHADIKMTWNRYGHLFPDERHAEKMNVAARAVFGPL